VVYRTEKKPVKMVASDLKTVIPALDTDDVSEPDVT
jgi:hypothetical protein